MSVRFVCAWYDLWVGVYYDRGNRALYVLPLPCLGFCVELGPRNVTLTVAPSINMKIPAIKEIRAATGLGLREAKEAAEGTSLTLSRDVGLSLAAALRAQGASVEIVRAQGNAQVLA